MVKTKIISLLLLLSLLPTAAQTKFSWRRVAMDGSRRSDPSRVEASPSARKMTSFIDSFQPGMAELKEIVGYCPVELQKGRPESPLGNWVADIMIDGTKRLLGRDCDISIFNVGGIRFDLPKGNVTVNDIRSMFPFSNNLSIVTLSGARLLEIIEGMAAYQWEAISGMRIEADSSKVISVEVGGAPLDKEKTYTLATNDFILHGGDFLYLGEGVISCEVTNYDVYTFILSYLKYLRENGKQIVGKMDGRVAVKTKSIRKVIPQFNTEEPAPVVTKKDYRLTILHTNDTHSFIEAIRSGKYKDMGGVIERSIFIDSVRLAEGKRNVLLIDAGDFEQGTPYFTLFGGKTEIGAMNIMGYDVATMGNHEWDNGTDDLKKRLKMTKFKKVLCNYDIQDKGLRKQLKPYVIVRRGGLKIGILGILTDVESKCDMGKAGGLKFIEPSVPVTRYATFLKEKKHCDLVIVLSHYGIGGPQESDPGDLDMVPNTRNVDVVVGGHTHTNLKAPVYCPDADGKPVMIVTDYYRGLYIGEIKY